jgi:hypothetical protein
MKQRYIRPNPNHTRHRFPELFCLHEFVQSVAVQPNIRLVVLLNLLRLLSSCFQPSSPPVASSIFAPA